MPDPGEAYWAVKIMKGFLQQPYVIGLKCLMVQHAPRLFLRPVGPELLQVGPNICDVAIRVPGISCIGARMYLSKACSFQVMPEDLLAGE